MPFVLHAAGIYNLVWGAWTVLFPLAMFRLIGMEPPSYPALWQCVGMIVGVYGLAYWLAARDPLRNWVVVATGFIGKLAGTIGFFWAHDRGELPLSFGLVNLANDLLWIPAFYFILRYVWLQSPSGQLAQGAGEADPAPELLAHFPANTGQSLLELSRDTPLLVVFLRHLGCLFCREALDDLARQRPGLEASGIRIALVHQGGDKEAQQLFAGFGMDDLPRISDPARELYGAFGLRPALWRERFGPRTLLHALGTLLLGWHMQWRIHGGTRDQSPGLFLLYDGKVVMNFKQEFSGQRADLGSVV